MQEDTVPFEDDAWIVDEYTETQVMDTEEFLLCGETQYVDLGFGTQEEPLVEEEDQLIQGSDGLDTQVLDRFDEEAVVVADSDDDDATVFLEDSSEREISDSGDSHCRGANLLLSENKARELPNENIKSTELILCRDMESLVARFAYVRSAAFRSSARVAGQKLLNSDCSTLPNSLSSGQGVKQSSILEENVGEVRDQNCLPNMSVQKKNEGNRTTKLQAARR